MGATKFGEGDSSFDIMNLELNWETRCGQSPNAPGFRLMYMLYALFVRDLKFLQLKVGIMGIRAIDSRKHTTCSLKLSFRPSYLWNLSTLWSKRYGFATTNA